MPNLEMLKAAKTKHTPHTRSRALAHEGHNIAITVVRNIYHFSEHDENEKSGERRKKKEDEDEEKRKEEENQFSHTYGPE